MSARARRSRSARASGSRTWCEMEVGGNSEEFIESVKVDLFPDKVYVFTPRGEILRLPRGATVVDFAYAVHTDIGNRCVAAKIDRRLTPLRAVLRNGQTVQIITAKGATPNPSWVNFVVTAKARIGGPPLPQGPASQRGAWNSGRRLLEPGAGGVRYRAQEVDRPRPCSRRSASSALEDADELYEKIGLGERLAPLVARRLLPARSRRQCHARARPPHRWPWRAPRGCWSATRTAAIRMPGRPDLRLPEHRPRHRRASRDLRQRRRLPQAARQMAARDLAAQARTPVPGGDPHRYRQPHGHAGGAVGRHRRAPTPTSTTSPSISAMPKRRC